MSKGRRTASPGVTCRTTSGFHMVWTCYVFAKRHFWPPWSPRRITASRKSSSMDINCFLTCLSTTTSLAACPLCASGPFCFICVLCSRELQVLPCVPASRGDITPGIWKSYGQNKAGSMTLKNQTVFTCRFFFSLCCQLSLANGFILTSLAVLSKRTSSKALKKYDLGYFEDFLFACRQVIQFHKPLRWGGGRGMF